jgi:hypothetical protein
LAVDKNGDIEGVIEREHRVLEIRSKGHVGANEIGSGYAAGHPGAVVVALRPPDWRKLISAELLSGVGGCQPFAVAVGLMTDRALVLIDFGAVRRI